MHTQESLPGVHITLKIDGHQYGPPFCNFDGKEVPEDEHCFEYHRISWSKKYSCHLINAAYRCLGVWDGILVRCLSCRVFRMATLPMQLLSLVPKEGHAKEGDKDKAFSLLWPATKARDNHLEVQKCRNCKACVLSVLLWCAGIWQLLTCIFMRISQ